MPAKYQYGKRVLKWSCTHFSRMGKLKRTAGCLYHVDSVLHFVKIILVQLKRVFSVISFVMRILIVFN